MTGSCIRAMNVEYSAFVRYLEIHELHLFNVERIRNYTINLCKYQKKKEVGARYHVF